MKNLIIVLILICVGSFGCTRKMVQHETTLKYSDDGCNTELSSKEVDRLYRKDGSVYAEKDGKVYTFNSLKNKGE